MDMSQWHSMISSVSLTASGMCSKYASNTLERVSTGVITGPFVRTPINSALDPNHIDLLMMNRMVSKNSAATKVRYAMHIGLSSLMVVDRSTSARCFTASSPSQRHVTTWDTIERTRRHVMPMIVRRNRPDGSIHRKRISNTRSITVTSIFAAAAPGHRCGHFPMDRRASGDIRMTGSCDTRNDVHPCSEEKTLLR